MNDSRRNVVDRMNWMIHNVGKSTLKWSRQVVEREDSMDWREEVVHNADSIGDDGDDDEYHKKGVGSRMGKWARHIDEYGDDEYSTNKVVVDDCWMGSCNVMIVEQRLLMGLSLLVR